MANYTGFIFNKWKVVPTYTGPTFALQPLPGGSPQDFYDMEDGTHNTQADGLGTSLADWEAAHTTTDPVTGKPVLNFYYFEMTDQRGGVAKARPLPGERPMLGYDPSKDDQFLRYNAPGGVNFKFSVSDGASQEDYNDDTTEPHPPVFNGP